MESDTSTSAGASVVPAPATTLRRPRAIDVYIAVVAVCGLAFMAVLLVRRGVADARGGPTEFWWLSGLLLLSELVPIRIPRRHELEEITTSTIVSFAILIRFGPPAAALVH